MRPIALRLLAAISLAALSPTGTTRSHYDGIIWVQLEAAGIAGTLVGTVHAGHGGALGSKL